LALEDHDFLVEVEREFIMDKMNLIKLREASGSNNQKGGCMSKIRFKKALRMILSNKVPTEEDLQNQ
jgi:hypothetical protein